MKKILSVPGGSVSHFVCGYKKIITVFAILMISVAGFSHTVTGYTPTCGSGPQYSIQPIVSAVNSSSNYRWQFKNTSGQWVCMVNGTNVINGFSFNVTGAVYNLTTSPGPIVFTNPNTNLNGVIIRCVISDGNGVDPCTMPSGNTWNSSATSTNLTINVTGGSCGNTPSCNAHITGLYFNKLDGGTDITITNGASFERNELANLYNLEASTTGTVGSVKFTITGPVSSSNIENFAPYNSPATSVGAWIGTPGSYSVNIKAYNGADAGGTVCHDTTISFSVVNDCNCTGGAGNLLTNGSFESGTTGWSVSGGTITTGTPYAMCGTNNGFLNWSSGTAKIWQDVTSVSAGATVTLKAYAGTHTAGISCSPKLSLIFLNSSNAVISQSDAVVTRDVDGPLGFLEEYTITATAPAGTVKVRVQGSIGCNTLKIDAFCLTASPSTLTLGNLVWHDLNGNGIFNSGEDALAGVTVKLYNDANNNDAPDGAAIATTTTNASGNYTFSGLSAGNYIVGIVIPNGFVNSGVNGGDPDNNTDNDNNGVNVSGNELRGLAITLSSGAEPGVNTNNTYDFGLINDCNCAGGGTNLLTNPSFETNNSTGWSVSGGNITTGTSYAMCGTYNGFLNWSSGTAKIWQDVAGVAPGATVTLKGYAGTHTPGINCSPKLSLIFLNSSNAVISQFDATVTRDVDGAISYLELYTITAVAPAGTAKVRVQGSIGCNTLKLDAFCLTAQANGSIGDRVWNDLNRNGIQDAGEVGVAGITVSLYDNAGALIASTITDAYGLYKFNNLATSVAGTNYQVRFGLPAGYMFTTQNADAAGVAGANNSDANVTTGRTSNITLTLAVPNVTYADAGIIITQPNRIGDFVWNDLDKDGVQDPGEPGIAGVTVTLYDNTGAAIRTTVTNNNGYYEFKDVPNGTYSIGISMPVGYQASPKDQGGDDAKDSDLDPTTLKTASFVFSGGVDLTFDFGLNVTDPSKASVGDYVWIDLNNDNLQDANEPAVPNVTVQLYTSANVLVATTVTDAFGYYIFNNVTPGNYYVKFSNIPAGYNFVSADAGTNDYKDNDVNGANGAGTTATFTVLADFNYTQYDAGIRATTALNSLGDFVWYDLNKNGIQDGGEAGVPGISVTLYNATTGAILKTTTTNSNGLYMFTDLAAGSYAVGFGNLPAGYAFTQTGAGTTATDSDPNPNTGRTGTTTIAGTGNIITTVDAGIVSNPNVFDAKASLGDYVWNDLNNNGIQDAGEPGIAGVTVTLYAADGTTVVATTTTDALGKYLFTNLNAGTYIVGFSGLPAGYSLSTLPNAGSDDAKDSDADPVTGKTGPVTLLAGQVNITVDAAARNASVLANLGDRVWNDLNGNGFQDAGEPGIPGVSVFLLDNSGAVIKNTVSDANGFYLFTDLAGGTYKVRFGNLPAGFAATTKDATPVNDATDSDADATTLTTDNITLAAGATDLTWDLGVRSTTLASVGDYVWSDVNGNGQQDAGEPGVPGVLVTLYNSAGTAVASAVTDANGKYLFVNVTPGTYTIGFSNIPAGSSFTTKDNGADASDSDPNPATGKTDAFTLVAGQNDLTRDAGLVVRLAAVGNYTWFDLNSNGVQDATEPPAAGMTVILYDSGNNPVGSAVTDGNGFYLINNIPVPVGGLNYTIGFSDKPATTIFTVQKAGAATPDNNSDANTTTGITDPFFLDAGQIRLDQDAGLIRLVNLSGNVWHDVNALDDNLVNNSGALQTPPAPAIPTGLRAYLVNASTGLIERVVLVNSVTGTYAFFNITPNTNYFVYLSQQVASVGSVPPPATLPAGWNHTGQKLGITSGSDGIPGDGRLGVPVFSTDVINANFGIRLNTGEVVIG